MISSRPSQNEVLEAEKDIIEDSLRLETEELKMEEEWEKLRLLRKCTYKQSNIIIITYNMAYK